MRFSIRNDSGSFSETLRLTKDEDIETIQDARIMWRHQPGGTARASIEANSSDVTIFKQGSSLNERMRLDANGELKITSNGSAADGAAIDLKHNNNNTSDRIASILFSNSVGEAASIRCDTVGANNSGVILFNTTNSGSSGERLRIQSGGGISFNGDTAQANALDDYEQGTWSPTVFKGSEVTGLYRIGTYTRIGRIIHLAWYIYKASVTTSGSNEWKIGGLPYSGDYLDLANGSYQFLPAGYLSVSSTPHNSTMSRWQVNATNQLTLYSGIATTNSNGGHIEFSGTGVLTLS